MGKKILTVDDSATARFQVVSTLSDAGYVVIEAENGDDALKKLEAHPDIVLVISDINMPWKDGIELLEEIRGNEKTKALKPFKGDALVAVVNKVCA